MKTLSTGIMMWLIALVVEIARSAPSTQIWICLVGAGLGVVGLIYSVRRLRREAL